MLTPAMCLDLYINDFKPTLISALLSFFCMFCLIVQKHIRYEFKSRKENCIKYFSLFKKEYLKEKDLSSDKTGWGSDFDNDIHSKEVFDRDGNFLYTELFVELGSGY
jgi:hypothetical protein